MLPHTEVGCPGHFMLRVTCGLFLLHLLAGSSVTHAALCPDVCICSPDSQDVACQDAGLEEVPKDLPKHLRTLSLRNNKVTTNALSGHLDKFPLLYKLDLSYNYLREINSKMFSSLSNLKILNLTFNSIASTEPFALSNNIHLEQLDLSHNQLQQIDADIGNLTLLKLLNLSSNNIHYIENSTFQNFLELRTLDLSFNQLGYLDSNTFKGLSMLEELYLQWNYLVNGFGTVGGWSWSLPSVMHIDVSHNLLTPQENRSDSNFEMLQYLDISHNEITVLTSGMFTKFPQLRVLNLGKNPIENIADSVFQNVPNLEKLYLDNCTSLSRIPESFFHPLTMLRYLNLSNNPHLSFLPVSVFRSLHTLNVLDISGNNLTSLPQATFHTNNNLNQLYLSDNPFTCDCSAAWIKRLIESNHTVKNPQTVRCVYSSNLSQPLMMHVDESTLPCTGPVLMSNDTDIYKPIGSSALLSCDVYSLPAAVITWVTPHNRQLIYHKHHPDAVKHFPSREDVRPGGLFHENHPWHQSSAYFSHVQESERVVLLNDGTLFIDYVQRHDGGSYKCIINHPQGNLSHAIMLHLDFSIFQDVKIMSIVVGLGTSAGFFAIAMVIWGIKVATNRCINQRKRQAIKNIIDNIDAYKTHHIGRIKEIGASHMGKFRDQYHTQLDRLRDNYNQQMIRIRENCAQQMDKIRDNYATHVGRLKDYSSNRLERLRDNYNTQIIRIREYGSLQLERLRENYKLQQQHLIKILETMNFDNCKTVIETDCVRAESMLFDSEVLMEPIDSLPYLLETDPPSSTHDSGSELDYVTASSNSETMSNTIETCAGLNDEEGDKTQFKPSVMQLLPGLVIQMPPELPPVGTEPLDNELLLPPAPVLELPSLVATPRILAESDTQSENDISQREQHKKPHRKRRKVKHRPKKDETTVVVETETLLSGGGEIGKIHTPDRTVEPLSHYKASAASDMSEDTQQISNSSKPTNPDSMDIESPRESIV